MDKDKTHNPEVAIGVENVSKTFKLPHEKYSSVKSIFVNFYKRKKTYELQHALNEVTFQINKGEFFGIVGRNGSGKSTLLKLIAGIYSPTKGQIKINGSLTPFIELGVGFNPELTGRENVFLNGALLGFNRKQMKAMYKDIVEFAELEKFMDQKLKNYSSGMQVRLAFSIAIRARSDILLLDEVLAVGDAAFQRKCFSYFKQLKRDKKTVVFISHDMGAVKEFCDRGILIDSGELIFEGPADELAVQYSELFSNVENNIPVGKDPRHTGDGRAKVVKASSVTKKSEVVINSLVIANDDIEELLFGIHIVAEDGREIAAMNNRTLNLSDIKDFKKGAKLSFEWTIQNIFNDGRFFITLSLADGAGATLDRCDNATSFVINRPERSTTPVLPPIKVVHRQT